jgi:DNA-binding protein YbaB
MFKGLAGMASLMGNLHQIPDKLEAINRQMRDERVEGVSADGLVHVLMNGLGEMQHVRIDPSLVANGHPEGAELALCEAVNVASAEAKRRFGDAMHGMAKDMNLNLPGMESFMARMVGGSGG